MSSRRSSDAGTHLRTPLLPRHACAIRKASLSSQDSRRDSFGGPLFTLLKALTTIQLAERVAADHGVPTVAVFWIDAEDHDWDEVRSCGVLDGDLNFAELTIGIPPEAGQGARSTRSTGRLGARRPRRVCGTGAGDRVHAFHPRWITGRVPAGCRYGRGVRQVAGIDSGSTRSRGVRLVRSGRESRWPRRSLPGRSRTRVKRRAWQPQPERNWWHAAITRRSRRRRIRRRCSTSTGCARQF